MAERVDPRDPVPGMKDACMRAYQLKQQFQSAALAHVSADGDCILAVQIFDQLGQLRSANRLFGCVFGLESRKSLVKRVQLRQCLARAGRGWEVC